MDVFIVLTIGEALAGVIGGIIIGDSLADSSFGRTANAFIGLVGGVTVGYMLPIILPDIASSVGAGSLGAILSSLVGAGVLITICALMKDNLWSVSKDRQRR